MEQNEYNKKLNNILNKKKFKQRIITTIVVLFILFITFGMLKGYYDNKREQEELDSAVLKKSLDWTTKINSDTLYASDLDGTVWYVGNSTSGNGNALSWANKVILSGFNWNNVEPGDSVYVDGGTDSLTYDFIPYSLYPEASGVANKKIIITRGKERGHNGKPIFLGSDTKNCAIIDVNYIELNNLVLQNGGINGGCVIGILGGMGVDIFNCEIWHPRTIGILVEASNVRVIYNTIKTGIVANSYGTDGMWVSGGASSPNQTGAGIYGNIEIAYNYFLMQNGSGTGHKDAVQLTMRWQEKDGLTKIHHNYMGAITSTPSTNADLIYVDDGAAGHYEIYNNVFVQKNFVDGGGYVNFIGDQQNLGVWAKVYNNTVYNTTANLISWKFYNCDSLDFRNNVIYAPNCWVALGIDYYTESQATYINIDYNQYQLDALSSFAYMQEIWEEHPLGTPKTISWNIWKTRMSADSHSEANSGLSLVEENELSASSYKLNAGTTGVDEGVTIPFVTDDYLNITRPQGVKYDCGGFER